MTRFVCFTLFLCFLAWQASEVLHAIAKHTERPHIVREGVRG